MSKPSPDDARRRVVFSTDPEPVNPAPPAGELPAGSRLDAAAPIKTRQLNTPVIVALEKSGRKGKAVSVVKGVMSPPPGKQALLKLLKTRLGTGGTLKDDVIEIQGDHRDAIVALLTELGYKAKRSGG